MKKLSAHRPPRRKKKDETPHRRIESRSGDSSIIHEALDGHQAAYDKLMRKYHDAIYNLIYRMVREKEEVEDLTQEAFIKAFASLRSFNEEYAFSTWLYKIATNNCIDYIRKKKLETFSIDKPIESKDSEMTFEVPDTTYQPDKAIIAQQRKELVEEAIESLPEKYRRVIVLRHQQEKNYEEIAEILKLPIGTVKAHIFRAREMLYRYLRLKMRNY